MHKAWHHVQDHGPLHHLRSTGCVLTDATCAYACTRHQFDHAGIVVTVVNVTVIVITVIVICTRLRRQLQPQWAVVDFR